MFRPVNILDLFSAVFLITAAQSDGLAAVALYLIGFALLAVSAWGSHLPDESRDEGSGNGI